MSNIITTTILRLFDFAAGGVAKSADVDAEYDQLVASVNTIKTDLDTLNADKAEDDSFAAHIADLANPHVVTATQAEFDNTASGLVATDANAAIGEVFAATEANDIDIVSLQGQITSNDGDISTLQATKANITYVDAADADMLSQIESNDGDITDLQVETASLQGQVTGNDGDIATINANKPNTADIYTRAQLQGSSLSQVHWDNLTHVPNMADPSWKPSVATPEDLPTTGNEIGDQRTVLNDGDGKIAFYVCVALTGNWDAQWDKIGDVDWASGEDDRVLAENARVIAEDSRVGAEDDRVVAEDSRVAVEATRVTAEGVREQFTFEGDFSMVTAYVKNNVVFYQGSSFVATQNTQGNVPTNVTYWDMVAQVGEKGAALSYKGTYDIGVAYTTDDLANYTGTLWVATQDSTGQVPGELSAYWEEFISSVVQVYVASGPVVCPSITYLDGTLTVGTGTYRFYTNTDFTGNIVELEVTGGDFSIADGELFYVVANYNNGAPVVQAVSDIATIGESTIIPISTVLRRGTQIQTLLWGELALGSVNKIHARLVKTQRFALQSGLALSVSGMHVVVASGVVWHGTVADDLEGVVTSLAENDIWLAEDTNGTWTYTLVDEFDNTHYNDLVTGFEALAPNRYAANWVFRAVDPDKKILYIVLGTTDAGLDDTLRASMPAIPAEILAGSMLVGRIVVKRGETVPDAVEQALAMNLSYAHAAEHNNLSGLQGGTTDEYYHLTSAEKTNIDGVTSPIQTQLNGKLSTTGKAADANKLDGKDSTDFNQIIGTDTDINTSGATIIDNIYVTDGVITSMGTRTLTPADIGTRKITSGTADPSGGASGDVYLQYE